MFEDLEECFYIVACGAVTIQRPRGKQIYEGRYWVTVSANKSFSHGNNLSNVSTARNHHITIKVQLETVFSTAVRAEIL
jgi:hypothetical protein